MKSLQIFAQGLFSLVQGVLFVTGVFEKDLRARKDSILMILDVEYHSEKRQGYKIIFSIILNMFIIK